MKRLPVLGEDTAKESEVNYKTLRTQGAHRFAMPLPLGL